MIRRLRVRFGTSGRGGAVEMAVVRIEIKNDGSLAGLAQETLTIRDPKGS